MRRSALVTGWPCAKTSGFSRRRLSCGADSSTTQTKSTGESAAAFSARSCSGKIGRTGPRVERAVAGDGHDEHVALAPGLLEMADDPRMDEVEDPVALDHGLAGSLQRGAARPGLLERQNDTHGLPCPSGRAEMLLEQRR